MPMDLWIQGVGGYARDSMKTIVFLLKIQCKSRYS